MVDLLGPAAGRPRLMGVVNVTPDSFSDGGRWDTTEAAVAHGRELLAEGADLLDIGGESTRPGATRPLLAEELGRVVPVISALAADGAVVSVDTMRARWPRRPVAAGAAVVNDVSGGLADPRDAATSWRRPTCRTSRCTGARTATTCSELAVYDGPGGVVAAYAASWPQRVEAALAAGVAERPAGARPGARLRQDRGAQLAAAPAASTRSHALGCPLLVGSSRKSFLGSLLGDDGGAASGRGARARQRGADHAAGRSGGCGVSGCTRCVPAWTPSGWCPGGDRRRRDRRARGPSASSATATTASSSSRSARARPS